MQVTLPDFSLASVLVVGDVMLDRYWYGSINRISPEAPVPIIEVKTMESRPGGAANVAMNIASLGRHAHLIGFTGIDEAALSLKEHLSQLKVICDFIVVDTQPTITKLPVLSRNQQLIRLDFDQGFYAVDPSIILERIKMALPKNGALVLSDYAKGTLTSVREIIMLAREVGMPVLIDPKGNDFSRYQGATLLTPNLFEFEAVVGHCKDENTLVSRGMKMIAHYQLSSLIITRSDQGMTLLQLDKEPLHFMIKAKEVYDVTDAGDTVIAVLAAALSCGKALEESCMLANASAGVLVGKLGTATVSITELAQSIRNIYKERFGIMLASELKEAVTIARKRGEKLVMTNGIFDILHAGHVRYLANARRLGDRLIVAVNSDDSTKRLKGKSRPVNSLAQRMAVLSAIEAVVWVVSFSEDTPQKLIADVLPDVLVKGGDYEPHQLAGSKEVWDNWGDVLVLNFEDGYSSTNIINAIKFIDQD